MKKLLQAIGNFFSLKVLSTKEYDALIDGATTGGDISPTKPTTLLTYSEVVSMLSEYDATRLEYMIGLLGFEDTRVNTFNFAEMKNYLAYTEKLAKEKGIELRGISFIKGAYTKETAKHTDDISYENLMYVPTALIKGKEVQIDLINSTKDNRVSFKEILEKNGYNWRYDDIENFITKKNITKNKEQNKTINKVNETQLRAASTDCIVANYGNMSPPH